MTPHLRYAQVRRGWNRAEGGGTGIIELKDLYYFLDAVRLLDARRARSSRAVEQGSSAWLGAYLGWLETSPQGARERARRQQPRDLLRPADRGDRRLARRPRRSCATR